MRQEERNSIWISLTDVLGLVYKYVYFWGECRSLLEFLIFVTLEVVRMKIGAKLWVNFEGMTHLEVGHTNFSSSP